MNRGLKETRNMETFTLLGYFIFAILFIIMLITQNWILLVVGTIVIIALRLIGYSLDRIKERKEN